jgi:hypothetical protein
LFSTVFSAPGKTQGKSKFLPAGVPKNCTGERLNAAWREETPDGAHECVEIQLISKREYEAVARKQR